MTQPNPHYVNWSPAEQATAQFPFASAEANEAWIGWDFRAPSMWYPDGLMLAYSRWRPDDFESIFTDPSLAAKLNDPSKAWLRVMEETRRFDSAIVAKLDSMIPDGADVPPHHEKSNRAVSAFRILSAANTLREGEIEERVLAWAEKPLFLSQTTEAVDTIVRHRPMDACRWVIDSSKHANGLGCVGLYRLAVRDLGGVGGKMMERVLSQVYMGRTAFEAIGILINESPVEEGETVRKLLRDGAQGRSQIPSESSCSAPEYWKEITRHPAPVLGPLMHALLCGRSAAPRLAASKWLARNEGNSAAATAGTLLSSKIIDGRIGGATLLATIGDGESLARLREMHAGESSKQVRERIAELLAPHGQAVEAEPKKTVDEIGTFAEFEAKLAAKPKSIKAPSAPWLNAAALPPLHTIQGEPLSELARTFLFQRQAREAGSVHEEVAPILPFLDRARNAAFAHALLDQWFESDMKATTRWALDVAGITGDDTIIARLTTPIAH